MTDTKCEPPEELANRDGWHWVDVGNGEPHAVRWFPSGKWRNLAGVDQRPGEGATFYWRYLAPASAPATARALEAERDALSIAFTKLSAVLRVNMLRHVPDTSHAEIDAAIDACLGPVSRAALARAKAEGL
jgi:hypothetical protein